jgi:hypothetical protein
MTKADQLRPKQIAGKPLPAICYTFLCGVSSQNFVNSHGLANGQRQFKRRHTRKTRGSKDSVVIFGN